MCQWRITLSSFDTNASALRVIRSKVVLCMFRCFIIMFLFVFVKLFISVFLSQVFFWLQNMVQYFTLDIIYCGVIFGMKTFKIYTTVCLSQFAMLESFVTFVLIVFLNFLVLWAFLHCFFSSLSLLVNFRLFLWLLNVFAIYVDFEVSVCSDLLLNVYAHSVHRIIIVFLNVLNYLILNWIFGFSIEYMFPPLSTVSTNSEELDKANIFYETKVLVC